jgi:hypothetical protein
MLTMENAYSKHVELHHNLKPAFWNALLLMGHQKLLIT